MTVATAQFPADLHPYKRVNSQALSVNYQIFNGLVKAGSEPNTYEPALATEWEYVEDGKAIQFTLRDGVKFHNGDTMTVDDVVYSFKAASQESASSSGIDWLDWDGIKALDDKTIYIPFTYANSIALGYFATTNLFIVSEKAMEEAGEQFGMKPIGTGAYYVDEWVQGDHITLKAFEDYWGGAPKIKTLTLRLVAEPSQQMIELETGGVDLALDVAGNDIDRVEENEKLKMIQGRRVCNDILWFNTSKEPFDNKLVRQAVAYAMDKEAILSAVYQGQGEIAYGMLSDDLWGVDESPSPNRRYTPD